jgi:hypothetical protein
MNKCLLLIIFYFTCEITNGQITFDPNDINNYFTITYNNQTTPVSVKEIITKTTLQLSKYIKSTIPINIKVDWIAQNPNIQASCSSNGMISKFKNSPKQNTLFPISLAEKIAGIELNNSTDADIIMLINKNMNWYYGVDGKPNTNEVDLYTILLHELCHGLGLQSNFIAENNKGYLNGINQPFIYDLYLIDSIKEKLTNIQKYPNNSLSLYKALTSDSIYFSGTFVHIMNSNKDARIYAPKAYNSGSSISHLDYNTYPQNNVNSLLNYTKKYGESIHNLGPICEGILADLGWNDFLISVNQIKDKENNNYKPEILVYIDSIFNPNSLELHYSFDNFANEIVLPFVKTDTTNYYKSIIPSYTFEHTVGYYITVKDTNNTITAGIPNNYPINFYSFRIGIDTIKPNINYTAISEISEDLDTLNITAIVTDNVGIDSVWVNYLINPTSIKDIKDSSKYHKIKLLQNQKSNYYTGKVILKNKIKEGDYFLYQIVAIDSSKNRNISYTSGNDSYNFYEYRVGPRSLPFVSLDENFEDTIVSKDRFNISNFNNKPDFTISKPSGFSTFALHTKHPYPTAEYTGKTIDLTATLKNPVTIRNQEAYLEFDEIALLELSEEGTVFGDYEFWDYCIIEGSKDKINWYAFEQKGYKTESYPDWLSTFYSKTSIDINGKISSTADGAENLYHHHKVNLLGNKYLRKGDTTYIRFRLFSDAFQNAWGWAIDNLKIQTTAVNEEIIKNSDIVKVYPTISSNYFTIFSEKDSRINSIEAISILGEAISCSIEEESNNNYKLSINGISGMYFLSIKFNDGSITVSKVIVKAISKE